MYVGKVVEVRPDLALGVIEDLGDKSKSIFRGGAVQGADFSDLSKGTVVHYDAVKNDNGLWEATIVILGSDDEDGENTAVVARAVEDQSSRRWKSGRVLSVLDTLPAGMIVRTHDNDVADGEGPANVPVRFTADVIDFGGTPVDSSLLQNADLQFRDMHSAMSGKRIATQVRLSWEDGVVDLVLNSGHARLRAVDARLIRFRRRDVRPHVDESKFLNLEGERVKFQSQDGIKADIVWLID